MDTWIDALGASSGGGVLAIVLVFGAVAVYKQWIVAGPFYRDLKRENTRLNKDLDSRNLTMADLTTALNRQTDSFDKLVDELTASRREHEGDRT